MGFSDWWSILNLIEQVLWSVAIVCSLLSIIQTVLHLTGFDLYEDKNTTTSPAEALHSLFSPTNILTFLTFFSWTTIIALNLKSGLLFALIIGIVMGVVMVGLIHFLLYTEDKILDLRETVNHTGHVFRSIPPCKNGQGSVQVEIRGTTIELAAVTEGNALPEGAVVKVVEVIDRDMLVVQRVIGEEDSELR